MLWIASDKEQESSYPETNDFEAAVSPNFIEGHDL